MTWDHDKEMAEQRVQHPSTIPLFSGTHTLNTNSISVNPILNLSNKPGLLLH